MTLKTKSRAIEMSVYDLSTVNYEVAATDLMQSTLKKS